MTRPNACMALAMAFLSWLPSAGQVAQGRPSPKVAAPASPHPKPPDGLAGLEPFIDGLIAAQKVSLRIEGVTVAVVANGQLAFAKGYGWADRTRLKPVDPERTLFRIASISKLFV